YLQRLIVLRSTKLPGSHSYYTRHFFHNHKTNQLRFSKKTNQSKNSLYLLVMQPVFQKIMSPLMALLVLFSTMSFTVDMHFCGGHLVDKAIFSEVEKCGMEMDSKTAEDTVQKPSCCEDISITVEGQEELKLSFDKYELQ